jgi:hypothetical protein
MVPSCRGMARAFIWAKFRSEVFALSYTKSSYAADDIAER